MKGLVSLVSLKWVAELLYMGGWDVEGWKPTVSGVPLRAGWRGLSWERCCEVFCGAEHPGGPSGGEGDAGRTLSQALRLEPVLLQFKF